MLTTEKDSTDFLKNFFYKLCFCVGLGTMGYHSFASVSHWIVGEPVASVSPLESKVHSILKQPNLSGIAGALTERPVSEKVVEKIVYLPAKTQALDPAAAQAKGTDPTVAPLGTIDAALASASPSPSPGATPADGDPNAEGQLADGQVLPPSAVFPYAYMPIDPNAQATAQSAALADSNVQTPPFAGTVGTGVAANESNNASTSGSTVVSSGYYNNGSSAVTASLASSDIALLSQSMKGLLLDKSETVSGKQCSTAAPTNCTPVNSASVYPLRWDQTDGLVSAAGFSVKASSATSVQFNLSLSIQDNNLNTQSYSASTTASQISAHTEVRNGKSYRYLSFSIPDMTLSSSKGTLTSVQATLVYDLSTSSLTSDSSMGFSRKQVNTITLDWDSSPNRNPAGTSDTFINADQINYTMDIEKS